MMYVVMDSNAFQSRFFSHLNDRNEDILEEDDGKPEDTSVQETTL